MTHKDFTRWLNSARKGQSATYHIGNLQYDRLDASKLESAAVDRLANTAWEASREGWVSLVQRRVAPGTCAYIAQRRA